MEPNQEVRIPRYIVETIETHLSELQADSVEAYVELALCEQLGSDGFIVQCPEEKAKLEQRLRDLGYLA